jgi:hypothetical protein
MYNDCVAVIPVEFVRQCLCVCVCVQEGCLCRQKSYFTVPFMIHINREGAHIRADVCFGSVKSQERMQANN